MENKSAEYVFSNGTKVRIKKLSQFLITGLFHNTADELPVPMVLVKVGTRKEEKLIPNYSDPNYNRLYKDRQSKDQQRAIKNIAVVAIESETPEELKSYFEGIAYMVHGNDFDDKDVKKLWVMSLLDDEHELQRFQEAVIGLSTTTDKGLVESAERFQSDS